MDPWPPPNGLVNGNMPAASTMPTLPHAAAVSYPLERENEPATPGRDLSATVVSAGPKTYVDGVTKSGRRRRRHPVAEVKGGWTAEEDAKLKELVELYGEGSWSKLVPHFQGRIGKQLRERWNHELRPDIQKGAWTEEEEGKLVEQHRIHKNAWADIAKMLPGRTCNAIKNHWNATLRRVNRGSDKALQGPVELYMQELGLIENTNKRTQTHRTHIFQNQPRRVFQEGSGPGPSIAAAGGAAAAGRRTEDPTARWVPMLPPAQKIPPTAIEVPDPAGPRQAHPQALRLPPETPRWGGATPAQPTPAMVNIAPSTTATAASASRPPQVMQLDLSAIAEKWGHSTKPESQPAAAAQPHLQANEKLQGNTHPPREEMAREGAPAAPDAEKMTKEAEAAKTDKEAGAAERRLEANGNDVDDEGRGKDQGDSPTVSDPVVRDGHEEWPQSTNGETAPQRASTRRSMGAASKRTSTSEVYSDDDSGHTSHPDGGAPRRSKRQRLPPQDPNYHFYNRRDSFMQKGPILEEAAMALLLLENPHEIKESQGPVPAGLRRQRSHSMHEAAYNEEAHTCTPAAARLPRFVRKKRTGWQSQPSASAAPVSAMRKVADAATQTLTNLGGQQQLLAEVQSQQPHAQGQSAPELQALPGVSSLALAPPAAPKLLSLEERWEGHAALYGVNAAVATARTNSNTGGRPVPYATTVNVRDRLAGFIVGLASVADRWEMHPSAEKDRFRQGLGRSTDPKVVALRQAVLDKCVAIKGPSPGQAVHAMAALFAEMAPIVSAAFEAADHDSTLAWSGQQVPKPWSATPPVKAPVNAATGTRPQTPVSMAPAPTVQLPQDPSSAVPPASQYFQRGKAPAPIVPQSLGGVEGLHWLASGQVDRQQSQVPPASTAATPVQLQSNGLPARAVTQLQMSPTTQQSPSLAHIGKIHPASGSSGTNVTAAQPPQSPPLGQSLATVGSNAGWGGLQIPCTGGPHAQPAGMAPILADQLRSTVPMQPFLRPPLLAELSRPLGEGSNGAAPSAPLSAAVSLKPLGSQSREPCATTNGVSKDALIFY